VLVGQSNVVALASPVDAGEPSSLCVHAGFPIVTRATATLAGPCTGARSAVSSRGLCRGRFAGARVPPRCSEHSGRWVAPGESARSRIICRLLADTPVGTLRSASLHSARPPASIRRPHRRGTGGRGMAEERRKSLRAVAGAEARATCAHSRGFQMRA
jgi:hypothetical protein